MAAEAHLSSIALSQGGSRPLTDAATSTEHGALLAALLADGFECFVHDERPTAELVVEASQTCLRDAGVGAGEVDAIVIATESAWDSPEEDSPGPLPVTTRFRQDLLLRLGKIGLGKAHPYGLGLASCADLVPALMLAAHAVAMETHRTVLVVVADRQPRSLPRLMKNGAAVYSDIAAAALVTAERPRRGYKIGAIVPSARLAAKGGEPGADIAMTLFAVRELRERFRARTGRAAASLDHVVAGNFLRSSLSVITDTLGLRERIVRMDSKPHIAHGHAADALATLAIMQQSACVAPGESILLINSSLQMWNLACLTTV